MFNRKSASFTKLALIIFGFILCVTMTGCTSLINKPQVYTAGPLGFYKSIDSGMVWNAKNAVLNAQGKLLTIDSLSVSKIIIDPNDSNAIYVATNSGLWYSYTAGDSWQQAPYFGDKVINDMAVSYTDKCTVFVVTGQTISRTSDCMRTWQDVYFDNRTDLQINQIKTDHYKNNKNIVYATNNKGEVIKSVDLGKTWQTIKRINNPVRQLVMDADDSRNLYVVTENAGIYKTIDSGKTWSDDKQETDINRALDPFGESKNMPILVQDKTKRNSYILASRYGLLRTTDAGMKWEAIPLITPERSANIYALAIDPTNAKVIYYSTENTIYKSVDGGKNWATQKSPTSGLPNYFLIDLKDPKIIYMGAKENKQ